MKNTTANTAIERHAVTMLLDMLETYEEDDYMELQDKTFNEDYEFIYTYDAKNELEAYGVFDAIERVVEYEEELSGKVYTDITDPCAIGNMLLFIIGEELLNNWDLFQELYENDTEVTPDTNKALIDELKGLLTDMK